MIAEVARATVLVRCDYCSRPARLVTGRSIYPYRQDLREKRFWECMPCTAYVGCHPGTVKPLGRLANAELRAMKILTHSAFDPIWKARYVVKHALDPKYSKAHARGGRYKRLAELMGIPREECHIGMFDVARCRRALEIISSGALQVEGAS